nr:PREDICTED: putative gustatory receptor 22b [Tribolium castaneum]|eukprot:XP_015838342.1 PREDICTED: putative gustatory receptor 22b [Tribolium castaneum]
MFKQFQKKILSDIVKKNETNFYKNKKVDLVYLQLHQKPTTFMVCGLFPMNCSLGFSMIAGITTYVIYLVQFTPKSDIMF